MNKNELVYVMNVDWNWIKQRPHFIAELLNTQFNVHVMYQHRYGRTGLQKRENVDVNLNPIYVIPRGDRYVFLSKVNAAIKCNVVKKKIKKTEANILYLTFPNQVDTIPNDYKGIVIYDCMDNHPAFVNDERQMEIIIRQEENLINKASLVLVSSNHLIDILKSRYGNEIEEKINLVRNGYNGAILDQAKTVSEKKHKLYTFAYFGTISTWFNFDYILRSLEECADIQYELFGPLAGVQIPKHERIHYHGTIEHEKLLENIKDADCLIMPFLINEIIEAVDPVKLYEYINFNKNILTCRYEEIERFEPFVYFYTGYDEFIKQILNLKKSNDVKYSNDDRETFLRENSWKCRVDTIIKTLKRRGNVRE